jgi:hypothetical protein
MTGSWPRCWRWRVAPYCPSRWLAAAAILNGGALAGVKLRHFFWRKKVWAALGAAGLAVIALLLIRPDGRVHVFALDVGTGSAVLVRTPNGHQVLIDGGPDADRFSQSIGRVLPPTARTIGAGSAILNRLQVGAIQVADPDPWSATLRAVVQQAQADGILVASGDQPLALDGVQLSLASDAQSWLIQAGQGAVAVVSPQTSWPSLPRVSTGPSSPAAVRSSGRGPVRASAPSRSPPTAAMACPRGLSCRRSRAPASSAPTGWARSN